MYFCCKVRYSVDSAIDINVGGSNGWLVIEFGIQKEYWIVVVGAKKCCVDACAIQYSRCEKPGKVRKWKTFPDLEE